MRRTFSARGVAAVTATVLAVAALSACTAEAAPEGASSTDGIPEAALEVMNKPQYENGYWSVYVEDLETGDVVIDLDGDRMLQPGSFVKTYSTGAAWLEFGPDSTVTTPVKATGDVVGGVLQGDLVLVGQGDLTMGGRTKDDGTIDYTNLDHNDANPLPGATLTPEDPLTGLDDLAAQVKASGIDAVSGNVIVDDRLFSGELANQPISPIIINQNIIDVIITPGAAEGDPATAELWPAVAPWTVDMQVETVPAGETYKIDDPTATPDGRITVTGTIAADAGEQLKVYAFADPATFARTAFIEALGRAGVTVTADPIAVNATDALAAEDAVAALLSVAELESLPLAEEAEYVMKISYNRGAQTFICRLAVEAGSKACDDGMPVAGAAWRAAGLDTSDVVLLDGSGLERNYVTGENAAAVQRIMFARDDADRWRETLPILGVDGSLTDVQTDSDAAGKVFAKTGTLVDLDLFQDDLRFRLVTKTLGGIMDTESGRTLAFTIIVNQGIMANPTVDVLEANEDVGAVAAAIQQAF